MDDNWKEATFENFGNEKFSSERQSSNVHMQWYSLLQNEKFSSESERVQMTHVVVFPSVDFCPQFHFLTFIFNLFSLLFPLSGQFDPLYLSRLNSSALQSHSTHASMNSVHMFGQMVFAGESLRADGTNMILLSCM